MSAPIMPTRGLLLALVSAAAFGTSGVAAKALIGAGWTPGAAVFTRLGGAALVLTAVAVATHRLPWSIGRAGMVRLLHFGALAVAGTQFAYFNAVRTLDVGVALLIEFLAPVLLLGWTTLRARTLPSAPTAIGAAVAIAGLVLVIDPRGAGPLDPVGIAWALAAAVGLSGYFVLSAREHPGLSTLVMATGGTAVGAVLIGAAGIIGLIPLHFTTEDALLTGVATPWWVPTLWLVLVATVVAYLTGIGAISRLGTRLASFVGLTEVLAAVLIAWLVLAELPGPIQLVGGILILAGIVLVQRGDTTSTVGTRGEDTEPTWNP